MTWVQVQSRGSLEHSVPGNTSEKHGPTEHLKPDKLHHPTMTFTTIINKAKAGIASITSPRKPKRAATKPSKPTNDLTKEQQFVSQSGAFDRYEGKLDEVNNNQFSDASRVREEEPPEQSNRS